MESINDYSLMGFELDSKLRSSCGKSLLKMKEMRDKKNGKKAVIIKCVQCKKELSEQDAIIVPLRKNKEYACAECYEVIKHAKN